MKNELEKIAKVLPELRGKLDKLYSSETGKKREIKLLWKNYEKKHKELRDSREFKDLNLH